MFSRIAFYFHNSTDFFAGVFGVPFIDDIAEGCELVVAMGTVYTVIHRNKVNIMFGKHDLGIHTDLQIITPETRHIFDDNTLDKACLNICNHLLKARAVKGRTGNAIINIEFEVGISVFKSILLQDFFLRRDLSRSVFAKQCAIRIDKQQKERYNNVVIDNDVII